MATINITVDNAHVDRIAEALGCQPAEIKSVIIAHVKGLVRRYEEQKAAQQIVASDVDLS